jgi:glycosyltransferase involved in cell wall biosynthesis
MTPVEAMACGTPVVAFNRGSVAEVVDEGTSGYICVFFEEMISKLSQLDSISRSKCRNQAFKRFNVSEVATQYLSLFN